MVLLLFNVPTGNVRCWVLMDSTGCGLPIEEGAVSPSAGTCESPRSSPAVELKTVPFPVPVDLFGKYLKNSTNFLISHSL